ncbi:MAG: CoA transferase [Gammaproteobacteria bacterium]|nr:CoA transferase [Gammaproteobacteria bacterium]
MAERRKPDAGGDTTGGPLAGVRVLDLSRILAGPTCTQLMGDLGADVIKVEQPGAGDDTRRWGPPYVQDAAGADTSESAYYLCANRNKRSVTVDLASEEGQALVRRLAAQNDVLIENFKVGGLAKYGLDYATLRETCPELVYCSISGFGQTGPYAKWAGYDFLIQAMGGIMSITGPADGDPHKVGVGIADVMCGMYACVAILAALRERESSGEGQHIDIALLDSQVSWLINAGLNYLSSRETPRRLGNGHPNIVPYEVFPASDGYFALAVGNDSQFRRFCEFAGRVELADDPRFSTNDQRVRNRDTLVPLLREVTAARTRAHWLDGLADIHVPCGPVNDIREVFDDPQVRHREMEISMPHPLAGTGSVDLIGNPLKFSRSEVNYRRAPPLLGEHTEEVLAEVLGLDPGEISALRSRGVV